MIGCSLMVLAAIIVITGGYLFFSSMHSPIFNHKELPESNQNNQNYIHHIKYNYIYVLVYILGLYGFFTFLDFVRICILTGILSNSSVLISKSTIKQIILIFPLFCFLCVTLVRVAEISGPIFQKEINFKTKLKKLLILIIWLLLALVSIKAVIFSARHPDTFFHLVCDNQTNDD